ncbi:hypothetical protein PC117_g22837 [Phytophthora cactorum]|uniref:Uncharacterized protein n=1 Tax=Phytophthora cactorum TaxID=29920 RepID=A0A8T1B8N1_9STRA|nr:hypothetical protein PC117_g22837 [Phytophthora cactorum]
MLIRLDLSSTLSTLAVGSYGLHVRNDSNGLSTYNGIAFLNDTTTVFGTTTPSTSISCVRRSATTYDGADIEFWSKTTASQTGSLYRF